MVLQQRPRFSFLANDRVNVRFHLGDCNLRFLHHLNDADQALPPFLGFWRFAQQFVYSTWVVQRLHKFRVQGVLYRFHQLKRHSFRDRVQNLDLDNFKVSITLLYQNELIYYLHQERMGGNNWVIS